VDAELVALGVLHDHPVDAELLDRPQPGRADAEEPLDLGVDRAWRSSTGTEPPPLMFRSRCTRFLTVLASGTRWR
jgi:hypothetical protein